MGVIGGEEVAQKMDENEGKPSDGCYEGGGCYRGWVLCGGTTVSGQLQNI